MMRGVQTKQGLASLLVVGTVLAACAAALTAANSAPARTDPCSHIGAPAINADGNAPGDALVCPDGGNSVSDAFGTHAGNAVRGHTGANARADAGKAVEPGGSAEDSPGKPRRAAILSRSWRQIFPRAN